ncbi:MAG: nucleotidyl transferase AbiEii/AbiGii toxin family protein [Patescibacteria group bacterium]
MVSRVSKKIECNTLFLDRLPKATQGAFRLCTTMPFFTDFPWYLAGGTALALQVGHRQSVDLDFFTHKKSFNQRETELLLERTNEWMTDHQEDGTLFGRLKKAKMSLIAYPFFLPSKEVVRCGTVRILPPKDIAVMKIIAISQRGRKRDFLDLYWYCLHCEPLRDVVRRVFHHYPQDHNIPHLIKSLTYFEDAEEDPMPTVFFKVDWKTIKAYFRKEAVRIAKELLHIS